VRSMQGQRNDLAIWLGVFLIGSRWEFLPDWITMRASRRGCGGDMISLKQLRTSEGHRLHPEWDAVVWLATCLLPAAMLLLPACSPTTPTPGPSSPTPAVLEDPEVVVQSFYENYLLYPGNPLTTRAFAENPTLRRHLTAELVQHIDSTLAGMDRGGYDPFLCAQAVPDAVAVELVQLDETTAEVLVSRFLGQADDPAPVSVGLERSLSGEWLIGTVTCFRTGGEVATLTEAAAADYAVLPSSGNLLSDADWFVYSPFGFRIAFPAEWQFQLLDVEMRPGDPVVGYAHFFSEAGTVPLALVFINGDDASFRAFFPEPEGGGEELLVSGMAAQIEETVPGEFYYFLSSPLDPGWRVALRLIDRNGDLDPGWRDMVEAMLASAAWEGEP